MRWRRWWPRGSRIATRAPGRARGVVAPDRRAGAGARPPAGVSETEWALARARMVHDQLERRGLRDEELLRAFHRVPRHLFVDSDDPYGDRALAIASGQTISQPYVVAAMTAAARPPGGYRGARVLEVGTGSGYSAAILAEMGAEVTTIERHASLGAEAVERLRRAGYGGVRVVVGDGSLGWPEGAPYEAIIVTAAGPSVPRPLLEQLSPDRGRLVMPVGTREQQWLTVVVRNGSAFTQREVEPVVFVPLVGEHGFRE
ncbi:MAG: protein-L-isoaspartate(D-aspartate) O-methyltransferase [Actinobacteria bacterium]|nr:MAG: protein-L-isoaspartate(D-aspartate) O-methyltransferase [Actinomycetota bacterium]